MAVWHVNGEVVDPAWIDQAFHRIKSEAERKTRRACCERDSEFHEQATREVIDSILLAQEAERRIPPPSEDEVRAVLTETLQQWRTQGASWELLEAQSAELREEAVARLRMDRFTEEVWALLPEPDSATLKSWFAARADQFLQPARVRALHLVRHPGDDVSREYATLVSIRQRARNGEDFAEMARQHTSRPDGRTDLGWLQQEQVMDSFECMLFSLDEGEISPVFLYEEALHLVQVTAVQPAHLPSFQNVESEVLETYRAELRHQAMQDLADQLRSTAQIKAVEDPAQ